MTPEPATRAPETGTPPTPADPDLAFIEGLLREGGYGLAVERRNGNVVLTGVGTGTGVRLPDPADRAAVLRQLTRLRRTRRRRTRNWVERATVELETGGRPELWHVPDLPGGGGGDGARTLRLDGTGWSRLDRLPVDHDLPRNLADLAAEKIDFFRGDDGGLVLPPRGLVVPLPTRPGTVVVARPPAPGARRDGDRGPNWEVELEADPGALVSDGGPVIAPPRTRPDSGADVPAPRAAGSTSGFGGRAALGRLNGWRSLNAVVESDPFLRLHCATQPALAALAEGDTGRALLIRSPEPVPAHPRYPVGTVAVTLDALTRPSPPSGRPLLRTVIEAREEHWEGELDNFTEYLVRPLTSIVTVLLDHHRLLVAGPHERTVAAELSPELRLTGRVVLRDPVTPLPAGEGPVRVASAMRALHRTLGQLATAFLRVGGWPERGVDEVREAVAETVAEEFRRLDPTTADLLNCEHPLLRFVRVDRRTDVDGRRAAPRTGGHAPRPAVPVLSHARSLAGLDIGSMRGGRLLTDHAVSLDEEQSRVLVDQLVAHADWAAKRAVDNAHQHLGHRLRGVGEEERTVALVHHLLTRKQFLKGSRSHYPLDTARQDLVPFVRAGAPVRLVLTGFPVKHNQNGLKATGPLPDLAELGALVRLREVAQTVGAVHQPGVRITVLTDQHHFRRRPAPLAAAYQAKMGDYLRMVAGTADIELRDVDDVAEEKLGPGLRADRERRIGWYERALHDHFADFDPVEGPAALDERIATTPAGPLADLVAKLPDFFGSLLFSTPLPTPPGVHRLRWARRVFADIRSAGPAAPPVIAAARRRVLRSAWESAVRYVAVLRVDRDLGYDRLYPTRVRLTNVPKPGHCGFSCLGGSGLLPWHGTGAVDTRGHVSADFAVSLQNHSFVPVYSPLLGPGQPWMMVPPTVTRVLSGRAEPVIDGEFLAGIRLRRR
ncbi:MULTISPECIES: L-tyrosine/L-tryptophan isonitrile synthase family protein [Actinoalloteichus]|uniref:L-tyrosine/L-tryptophan isonitrile synthase family protein n=1 Tax=Actinoalloteichus TaxID=65496 RepID=UPI0012DC58B6|nr:L-tyrosine/L-tryptophan isonitrile synthase family protein [Actinoalloteichus caeruleus]